jgi:hypothetical protein
MASTQTHNNSNGKGAYDFKPVDFDKTIEPDAAPGQYKATLEDVKVSKTSRDEYPMLILEWQLTESLGDSPEQEKSVGATVTGFLVFPPNQAKGASLQKRTYAQLCELLGVDTDLVPTRLTSKADFLDFIKEVKGGSAEIWVSHRADKSTGEMRINVNYTAPRGAMAPMPSSEEEEPKETHNRSRSRSGGAKGRSARR